MRRDLKPANLLLTAEDHLKVRRQQQPPIAQSGQTVAIGWPAETKSNSRCGGRRNSPSRPAPAPPPLAGPPCHALHPQAGLRIATAPVACSAGRRRRRRDAPSVRKRACGGPPAKVLPLRIRVGDSDRLARRRSPRVRGHIPSPPGARQPPGRASAIVALL